MTDSLPRERPILFSSEMVKAILAGTKTQTRRAIKLQTGRTFDEHALLGAIQEWRPVFDKVAQANVGESAALIRCPCGVSGDRLYVRERFSGKHDYDLGHDGKPWPPRTWFQTDPIWYWADGNPPHGDWTKSKPGIHMPRWASRILLEITAVRVERLQSISEEDCIAEGARGGHGAIPGYAYHATPLEHYRHIWRSINGPASWEANPWCWCIEFRRIPLPAGVQPQGNGDMK